MPLRFALEVLYTQITVSRHGLPRPGLLWDDDHVAQGFAWGEETVAFGVPDHDGVCLLDVDTADASYRISPNAIWAVSVPFFAKSSRVDVGTVGEEKVFELTPGSYTLTFEALPGTHIDKEDYAFIIRIRFIPDKEPAFRILKTGMEVRTDHVLRTDARRA
jgi:hypothetical protein